MRDDYVEYRSPDGAMWVESGGSGDPWWLSPVGPAVLSALGLIAAIVAIFLAL